MAEIWCDDSSFSNFMNGLDHDLEAHNYTKFKRKNNSRVETNQMKETCFNLVYQTVHSFSWFPQDLWWDLKSETIVVFSLPKRIMVWVSIVAPTSKEVFLIQIWPSDSNLPIFVTVWNISFMSSLHLKQTSKNVLPNSLKAVSNSFKTNRGC